MNYCRNCKNKHLTKIIKIGNQPLSGIFYRKKKTNLKSFSLDLYKCKKCELIQLGKSAPTVDMYGSHYGYRTSLSKLMVNHIKNKFLSLKKNIKRNDMILDIGSNDGTFLNFFSNLKKNLTLIGTDPSANKFRNYYNKDIHLIVDFFSQKTIGNYIKEKDIKKKFSLITSFAMFYDIEDPNYFCKEIYNLLKKNGLWCLEMSYFPLLLENLTYDQICHEHVTYYTLSVFKKIAEKNNLKIIDISFNEINGGSIEIICARKESYHRICVEKIEKLRKS
jgi:SAM-dependent methyltransferase